MTVKIEESNVTRVCRDCGVDTPAEYLIKNRTALYGFEAWCKPCSSRHLRQYRLDIKPKRAYLQMKHRHTHLPQRLEVTEHQIGLLFEAFAGCCAYCRTEGNNDANPLGIDHVYPVSKHGHHRLSNLVIACKSCNSRKGNRSLLDFYDKADNFEYTSLISVIAHLSRFHHDDYMRILDDFQRQQVDYNSTD